MNRKNFVSLLAIMLVIICGGLGLSTANATNPVLSISFGANRNNVEPGFTRFLVTDSNSVINGIRITLDLMQPPVAGNWTPAWNARDRGGAIPTTVQWYLLYRQLIFARPGGIRITLSGLEADTPYYLEIWDYDSGSASPRIADVNVNDVYCMTIQCDNGNPPVTGLENYYWGDCTSDVNGVMVMELWPNPETNELAGSYNPYAIINGFRLTPINVSPIATSPVPQTGSTVDTTQPDFQWEPGKDTLSHDVYIGTVYDDVENATRDAPLDVLVAQGIEPNSYNPGLLQADTTYYWRIDEVNDQAIQKGNVWSFYIPPVTAYKPSPVNGVLFADANFLDPAVILSWYQAADATSYHVYFGDNLDDVQAGTGGTDQGTVTDPNYDPASMLKHDKIYYWRVDASDGTTTYAGDVWSFKTSPAYLGTIEKEIWEDVTSNNDLNVLKDDIRFPNNPTVTEMLTSFDTGADGYAQTNYGGRLSGWLYVPLTGNYTFWLGTAGQGELWLSTDDDAEHLMPQYLDYEPVWGNVGAYAFSHSSGPIPLIGGNKYYIEALWVSVDWDYCQVAWQGPGIRDMQIIQGCYLSPYLPVNAQGASPADGATDIELLQVLSWKSGTFASQHQVFFGTDPNAVRDADAGSPEYKGTKPRGTESFDPGILEMNTTYYWRVDEVNDADPNSPWIGKVWNFTTGAYIIIDDFEAYNDLNEGEEGSNRIYLTWSDGYANPNVNGSTIGYPAPDFANGEHFVETNIVHGGRQSGPFLYNNTTASYSEVTLPTSGLALGSDWTQGGLNVLSLWIYGDPNNTGTGQLYVKLNNSKQLISGINLTQAEWQNAEISLADFGINLANVTQLVIGLERTGATGGEGILFLDDIRLRYVEQ
jgi:hypothetical protein